MTGLERVIAFLNAADGDDGFVRACRKDLDAHLKENAARDRYLAEAMERVENALLRETKAQAALATLREAVRDYFNAPSSTGVDRMLKLIKEKP